MIIDTPWRTTNFLTALKSEGVETIIRYYNRSNSSTLPEKCITLSEKEAILTHDISIAIVFQQRQNQVADFDSAKGSRDANAALSKASDLRQPPGSAIYFSVDFDANTATEVKAVTDYFEAVHQDFAAAGGSYKIGVYGNGLILEHLQNEGLVELTWLAMSRGWTGSRDYHASKLWAISQIRETRIAGLDVDTNESNPLIADFGAFGRTGPVSIPIAPPHDSRSVIARSGLWLRAGPSTDFDKIRLLRQGTRVDVLGFDGAWAKVDLEGDGLADGFCHGAFLS